MFKNRFAFYFDAPDSGSGGGDVGDKDWVAEDLAFLSSDEDDDSEIKGEEKKEELSPDDKDDKEIKEIESALGDDDDEEDKDEEKKEKEVKAKKEEKEDDDDETKDEDPVKEATYNSIKKKYPKFFKEFPEAKNQIFAAEAFRRVFPTVEEAKNFKDESGKTIAAFEGVKELIIKGETDTFLSEVKDLGDEAYQGFVANFLPALFANDEKTYYKLATPIVRSAIKNIYERGLKNGGKKGGTEENFGQNLVNASIVLHHALFDSDEVEKEDEPLIAKREDKADPEKEKFNKERQSFYEEKYRGLKSSVESTIQTTIISEIEKGLDPNNVMPAYIRKNIIRDIFNEIDKQVSKDETHIAAVNSFWEREKKAGFSGQEKNRIINAVLSRARQLIPVVRKRVKEEALKGLRKTHIAEDKEEKKEEKKPVNRASSKPEKRDLRKTAEISDFDILNMD